MGSTMSHFRNSINASSTEPGGFYTRDSTNIIFRSSKISGFFSENSFCCEGQSVQRLTSDVKMCNYPVCNSHCAEQQDSCSCPFRIMSPILFDEPVIPYANLNCSSCQNAYVGDMCETNIPECEKCGPLATCVYNPVTESFACSCMNGSILINGTCDINECGRGRNPCSEWATCTNTIGSFNCSCKPGFSGDGFDCKDYNECENNTTICGSNSTVYCQNENGSYSCKICDPGYYNFNYTGCIDFDECSANKTLCYDGSPESYCMNTNGSYSCAKCNTGYYYNGSNCADINECNNNNICYDNSTTLYCKNTVGSYFCDICRVGYYFDGTNCSDVDECAENMCDIRVNCQNYDGGYECGPCPLGYTGSGNKCEALCGDNICNATIGENCVSCHMDCKINNCSICGDGICDSGENCTSCSEDCLGSCTPKTCPSCVHGQCLNGVCRCSSTWSGPSCDVAPQPVVVVITNTSQPIVNIFPSSPSSQKGITQFTIAIRKFVEKDPSGNSISSLEMSNLGLNFSISESHPFSNTSNNRMWVYSTILSNGAEINITFIEFRDQESKYAFYNENMTFGANTLKINLYIAKWPFKSIQNTLDVVMDNEISRTIEDNSDCELATNSGTDSSGSLQWVKITYNGVAAYAEFAPYAFVDGRSRLIQFALESTTSVSATLPHFWNSAEFDPNYAILVDTDTDESCIEDTKKAESKSKNNTTKIALITTFTIIGFFLLMGAIYLTYRVRRRQASVKDLRMREYKSHSESNLVAEKKQKRRFSGRSSSKQNLNFERRNDMEVNTVAGKFTVEM